MFNIAIKSILSNKIRASLTMIGVIIGIASIMIVFSAGAGIEKLILSQIESFGTNIIQTEIKVPTNKKGMTAEQSSTASIVSGTQITTLNTKDMEDIIDLPNISNGYSAIMSQKQVNYKNKRQKSFLFGTSASFIKIDKSEIENGRFFSTHENNSLSKVAVIGSNVKEELFGQSDAVGKMITIGNSKFEVIGIIKERGAVFTMNFDDYVYIPLKTLQKKIMGIDYAMYMVHQIKNIGKSAKTADKMRHILRSNHNISPEYNSKTKTYETNRDDFRVSTMDEMMDMLGTVTDALTILLLAIVSISLIVGGVGIMNIMYVTVNERTMEIGLRKAVGAKKGNILLQFLIESIIITTIGGIIGVLFGIGASYLISIGANSYGLDWHFIVPIKSYLIALIFSIIFGILFGLYPAKRAADLDPIVALKK